MIDLRPKDRERILLLFDEVLKGKAALWAYGSRVKNTNHEASDLDLVVVPFQQNEVDFRLISKFQVLLRESNIPILVHVQDWRNMPPAFRENILKEKEVMAE